MSFRPSEPGRSLKLRTACMAFHRENGRESPCISREKLPTPVLMAIPDKLFPSAETLAPLVRKAAAGARANDSDAANDLLEAVRPWLVHYFRRHGLASAAEDTAQLVLLRIVRAVERIDPLRAANYIVTIARRERIRAHRGDRSASRDRRQMVPLDRAPELRDPTDVAAELESLEVRRATLTACMVALDGVLRDTMIAYLQGADVSEIAARRGLKPGTVRTRLARARQKLKESLAPHAPTAQPGTAGRARTSGSRPTTARHGAQSRHAPPGQGRPHVDSVAQPAVEHYAFFAALASLSRLDDEWAETEAGLVTLRLVDEWVGAGRRDLDARGPEVQAVSRAIDAIRVGSTHRAVLGGLLDGLQVSHGTSDRSALASSLAAYARALQFDARWERAADVYRTIVRHLPVAVAASSVADAYMQLGGCLRTLGSSDQALDAYGAAASIGHQQSMPAMVVRAMIGEANVALQRGNLPAAEAKLDHAIVEAEAAGDGTVLAMALHDRAHVAHRRGQSERAVTLAYDALGLYTDPTKRDRALSDVALFLGALGLRDAARDAHLVIAATAQEQYLRWVATINLLELSELDRQEGAFDSYRSQLEGEPLPPELASYFHLYVARGFRAFGRDELAEDACDRAVDVAAAHGINEVLALVESDRLAGQPAAEPMAHETPTIAVVVSGLRDLRATVMGGRS